jgi:hypothetical protein
MRRGEAMPSMRPRRTRLAVYRKGFAVCFLELKARPFAVLAKLVEGVAAEEAMGGARESEIYDWFREWSSAGISGLDDLLRGDDGGRAER